MINLCGWIGAGLILLAYLLLSLRKLAANSYTYQFLNVIGAGAIGLSSYVKAAWPAAALNFSWMIIGVYALVTMLVKRKRC